MTQELEDETTEPQLEPPWLTIAIHQLGVQEIAGKMANPKIVEYLRTTKLPDSMRVSDETPWCSAFVNWCMERSGIPGTGLANARSWLTWGESLAKPKRGAVMVFADDARGPSAGHVTFYWETTTTLIGGSTLYDCLGGNQGNKVCMRRYPPARLLAIRWPTHLPALTRTA